MRVTLFLVGSKICLILKTVFLLKFYTIPIQEALTGRPSIKEQEEEAVLCCCEISCAGTLVVLKVLSKAKLATTSSNDHSILNVLLVCKKKFGNGFI